MRGPVQCRTPHPFLEAAPFSGRQRHPYFQAKTGSLNLMKEDVIEVEGRIHTILPSTMFRVELDNKHLVLATICGKMRKRWIRLTVGDRVKMEMTPYDLNKARITWRMK
jgi:translation initiation factor IF-1